MVLSGYSDTRVKSGIFKFENASSIPGIKKASELSPDAESWHFATTMQRAENRMNFIRSNLFQKRFFPVLDCDVEEYEFHTGSNV